MPFISAKTQVEQLQTELRALEDLLPYMTGERRERVAALIEDVKRKIDEKGVDNVVVIRARRRLAS